MSAKSSSDILEQADGCLWRALERVRRAYEKADGSARADLRAAERMIRRERLRLEQLGEAVGATIGE